MERSPTPPPETTPSWAAGFRRRVPFYILAAILLALLAGALTFVYLDRLRAEAVPTGEALVARRPIRPGTLIDGTMVELRAVPEALLPPDHITTVEEVLGREVVIPIAENEVLLPGKFAGGPGTGLSARLPDGRWAMVLPSGWLVSPVPELTPGDHLDLVAYQSGKPVQEAGVVVSAVEVLQFAGTPTKAEALTLAVSLEEAIAILYARANGFNLLALLRPEGG
ncbi:MAG: Flp pilus assembly protein CpaB [Anaerolineales bacterium]|nr:Flp pilus assembly protein CpaB [Anaerolineales bacterium]